jgi:hypothetical protein
MGKSISFQPGLLPLRPFPHRTALHIGIESAKMLADFRLT